MGKPNGLNLLSNSGQPPNILILVFDALSSLHTTINGYARQTSPNIERLAKRAYVYHSHYSAGNFTSPGVASLITGVYPWLHRAFHLHGTMLKDYADRNLFALAGPEYFRLCYSHNPLAAILLYQMRSHVDEFMFSRSLALADLKYSDRVFPGDYNASVWGEVLTLHGDETRASSLFLSPIYRVFSSLKSEAYNREYKRIFPYGIAKNKGIYYILEDGIDWCINQIGNLPNPFLAYLHFLPPHAPYFSRREFVDLFDDRYRPSAKPRHRFSTRGYTKQYLNELRQRYDEYIAYTDSEFGRLFDHLEKSGMLDNTILVLTSDHGEMFERGIWGHVTRTVYEPVLRVPLLLSLPGQSNRMDIHPATSSVDLVPTLLHLVGKPAPEWCEGQVLPPFANIPYDTEREIFSVEAKLNPRHGLLKTGTIALIKGPHKLIHYRGYQDYGEDKDELYNLSRDGDELENLANKNKDLAKDMRQILEEKLTQVNQVLL